MAAKIKILLGQTAFAAAKDARSRRHYADAITQYEASIRYGYEVQASQKGVKDVQLLVKKEHEPKVVKHPPKPTTVAPSTATAMAAAPKEPPAPSTPADPVEALNHYRQGLVAMKSKDFHRAITELKIATQLDPSNEHYYIALQRAQQEWNAAQESQPAGQAGAPAASPPAAQP